MMAVSERQRLGSSCGAMHAHTQHKSYIIVQALSNKRLQGFRLRPGLPPRQGLTPPLPLQGGLRPVA